MLTTRAIMQTTTVRFSHRPPRATANTDPRAPVGCLPTTCLIAREFAALDARNGAVMGDAAADRAGALAEVTGPSRARAREAVMKEELPCPGARHWRGCVTAACRMEPGDASPSARVVSTVSAGDASAGGAGRTRADIDAGRTATIDRGVRA